MAGKSKKKAFGGKRALPFGSKETPKKTKTKKKMNKKGTSLRRRA